MAVEKITITVKQLQAKEQKIEKLQALVDTLRAQVKELKAAKKAPAKKAPAKKAPAKKAPAKKAPAKKAPAKRKVVTKK